ncbi:hypothetical protein DM01DRAFT_1339427 [Hesseltinella vesiculosa]|uniref:Uncharacterized protein n=1 Tax=Hesseltinella vesiculosa TaxID=101127 RepID=A0A1X2G735_9FUNG|nr:hypothetical protein DM01DRAFT_1339427 [Hesseltinella vesiculosa]
MSESPAQTRRWTIKKVSSVQSNHVTPTETVISESDRAFDERLEAWSRKRFSKRLAHHLCHDVQKDMDRRQGKPTLPPREPTPSHELEKLPLFDIPPFMFAHPNQLQGKDYDMWKDHAQRDMHQPHQWLRLASLFHIHPKTQHQRSLLQGALRVSSQLDRGVSQKVNDAPLENYLTLRQTQNRSYAIRAVNEGIKLFENNEYDKAKQCYQRATDMDPTYPEVWFRVSEYHEMAKTLLCSLENTAEYMDDHGSKAKRQIKEGDLAGKENEKGTRSDKDKGDERRHGRSRHQDSRSRSRSRSQSHSRHSRHHRSPTDRRRHRSPSKDRRRHHSPSSKERHRSRRHRSSSRDKKRHRSTSKDRCRRHRSRSSSPDRSSKRRRRHDSPDRASSRHQRRSSKDRRQRS